MYKQGALAALRAIEAVVPGLRFLQFAGTRNNNGVQHAAAKQGARPRDSGRGSDVLLPGDKAKFGVWFQIPVTDGDMQFIPFQALFRDTFSESALMPVPLEAWSFDLDVAKTTEANK